jgi:hypothetical protein
MADIVVISKPDSPQILARKYMLGQLDPTFYANKHGGLFNLMRMADDTKSLIAAEKALKQLRDIGKLDYDQDVAQVHEIKLVQIENRGGKIVEIAS